MRTKNKKYKKIKIKAKQHKTKNASELINKNMEKKWKMILTHQLHPNKVRGSFLTTAMEAMNTQLWRKSIIFKIKKKFLRIPK
jgi:hypothetical protein